jgi:hypothetical protein
MSEDANPAADRPQSQERRTLILGSVGLAVAASLGSSANAAGGARAEVRVGQAVTFSGAVEVPPKTGKVVSAEWDFEGAGDYPVRAIVKHTDGSGAHATVTTSYAFSRPGTYFPALRAASQRRPDSTPYAQARNLARVRVVVT